MWKGLISACLMAALCFNLALGNYKLQRNEVHVLSLDGGGSRGIMESTMLEHIMNLATAMKRDPKNVTQILMENLPLDKSHEKIKSLIKKVKDDEKNGRYPPIHPTEAFDYIAGTSTGSLISYGLVAGYPNKCLPNPKETGDAVLKDPDFQETDDSMCENSTTQKNDDGVCVDSKNASKTFQSMNYGCEERKPMTVVNITKMYTNLIPDIFPSHSTSLFFKKNLCEVFAFILIVVACILTCKLINYSGLMKKKSECQLWRFDEAKEGYHLVNKGTAKRILNSNNYTFRGVESDEVGVTVGQIHCSSNVNQVLSIVGDLSASKPSNWDIVKDLIVLFFKLFNFIPPINYLYHLTSSYDEKYLKVREESKNENDSGHQKWKLCEMEQKDPVNGKHPKVNVWYTIETMHDFEQRRDYQNGAPYEMTNRIRIELLKYAAVTICCIILYYYPKNLLTYMVILGGVCWFYWLQNTGVFNKWLVNNPPVLTSCHTDGEKLFVKASARHFWSSSYLHGAISLAVFLFFVIWFTPAFTRSYLLHTHTNQTAIPFYSNDVLRQNLENMFGNTTTDSIRHNGCLAGAVAREYHDDLSRRGVLEIFDAKTPKQKVADVLLGSADAPVYFNFPTRIGTKNYIDGGISGNCPLKQALKKVLKYWGPKSTLKSVLSLAPPNNHKKVDVPNTNDLTVYETLQKTKGVFDIPRLITCVFKAWLWNWPYLVSDATMMHIEQIKHFVNLRLHETFSGQIIFNEMKEKHKSTIFMRIAPTSAKAKEFEMDHDVPWEMIEAVEEELAENYSYLQSIVDAAGIIASRMVDYDDLPKVEEYRSMFHELKLSMEMRNKTEEAKYINENSLENLIV